ncbi:hypothetical protein [Burkholderia ambifaria]|uniref:hypothetical protein n=1 Tax=Burkholderia ambifaria TaxID=152480 RepID=UPI00158EF2BF|nr:hypothetical protein [Burkholderia ambifaria]
MTEPILSREEVDRISLECVENTIGFDHVKFALAIEAAVLEKVCGEPIYQTSWKYPASVWGDVSKDVYDNYQFYRYADRRIVYALTRSKP